MKIGLRAGHSDNCTGAIGIVDEHEQMKKYYSAVKSVLESYGHTVIDCNSNANTENGELSEGANIANSNSVDFFASLHMNCYNGQAHGSEVLVSSENSGAYQVAQRLVQNFSELGFYNRGVKFEKLYEMNHISAPNIITEICFCDSQEDIDIYNKNSWERLAHMFCNAIDTNIPKFMDAADNTEKTGYVVTDYLPGAYEGYDGVNINYVLSYFNGIKCYIRGNEKGVWIETEYLPIEQCNKLKETLGSWFYSIEQ
ncbi:N-acetylmuramoyl-L-alanine amidase [Clostridium beijerinckii]|uniref:N-acetylmuramoyl-L-alanine amidase n=1 Tax=Clostridium beijerinckii TaxID=1520 RepID=A0AAW3W963_CLOBE|nr:N-acetylmuramoyl-L-alanine amidase [Clostridium beijerinckii]MBC2456116.1 N-acetylmuramoyl-L-alanine amidase [Clostridium beijerinckii]MBC2475401.1 N-acetylmuramoyl-L-alanine amidase [Clostridium beijerinckii]NOV58194.1 N-acetylmuramoyl-L-alanine amidase [Clostridium beijerinckii]NOV69544.1 N-acetylmuramoyl-L-alanine amidase [Clostridium beijerinckii]NOW31547.1 N-acetylmuramoyl-L-alanine amidase [Clostridium beijerinckii]